MVFCWGTFSLFCWPELNIFHASLAMSFSTVASQVINIVIVILFESVIGHEASMIVVNVGVSSWTIHMIMESLCGASTHGISCDLLWCKASLLWSETTSMGLHRGEIPSCISSHVETDVCVPTCAIGVVYSSRSCLRNDAAHFVS